MPYTHKKVGNKQCVYKKNGGAKVGCTSGNINDYLAALHMHANEEENKESKDEINPEITESTKNLIKRLIRENLNLKK